MKLAVLAHETIIAEWKLKPIDEGIAIQFVNNIDELVAVNADAYFDLLFEFDENRLQKLHHLNKPIFINAVENSLLQMGVQAQVFFVRINAWSGFLNRSVVEIAVGNETTKQYCQNVLQKMNWNFVQVPDEIGMVSPRIIGMIINEAYLALQEGVSTKNDIDIAMRQGTNYPYGPFEWAQKIGLKNICRLLKSLEKIHIKYTPATLLVQEAAM